MILILLSKKHTPQTARSFSRKPLHKLRKKTIIPLRRHLKFLTNLKHGGKEDDYMARKTLIHKSVVEQIEQSKMSYSSIKRITRAIDKIDSSSLDELLKSSKLFKLTDYEHGTFYLYRVDVRTRILMRVQKGDYYIDRIITADDVRKIKEST